MRQRSWIAALALGSCWTLPANADATFTYTLGNADDTEAEKTISAARFFARIEDTDETPGYLLFQAGKFFPLYRVDPAAKTYTLLTEPVTPFLGPPKHAAKAEAGQGHEKPAAAATPPETSNTAETSQPAGQASPRPTRPRQLKATRKSLNVAGIPCRVIQELQDGEPVMEHCMANAARLQVAEREVITLARTFAMAREQQLDWLGTGSEDEKFVAIRSRDLRDNRTLELKSVSTAPLPVGYLRIPREYKQLEK